MATLRRYVKGETECVVICTDAEEVDEIMEDEGHKQVDIAILVGDFSSWPTNRPLLQERWL